MTSIGRGIVFTRPIVLPLVRFVTGELVQHRAQRQAEDDSYRNILHARPQRKAQEQAYGDVAGESPVFCFFTFHDSKTDVNE